MKRKTKKPKVYFPQAYDKAAQINGSLKASDPRFNKGGVFLIHDDGSSFFWNSAFSMTWEGFILIFAEHHGFMVYNKNDVAFTGYIPRNKRK